MASLRIALIVKVGSPSSSFIVSSCVTKENELFALAAGQVSREFANTSQAEFYKVAEKDPARELTDDQKTKIHDSAYAYWFDKNRRVHDVRKLVPGYEFQP